MTIDIIENFHGSLIQHGKYNDRIYLIKFSEDSSDDLPSELITFAESKGYSKIFAKIPGNRIQSFFDKGFIKEASIPGFFGGKETAAFMGFYLDNIRSIEDKSDIIEKNLQLALTKMNMKTKKSLAQDFSIRRCTFEDTKEMSAIYKEVFSSYPFPIHDPVYLKETMKSHIDYYCILKQRKIVALSSAEMYPAFDAVEMTDFATLPEWLGNSFSQILLSKMENDMQKKQIKTSYTIARSMSPGMNITFSKAGYSYGGRLKNNTNISGSIESMNVWYKKL